MCTHVSREGDFSFYSNQQRKELRHSLVGGNPNTAPLEDIFKVDMPPTLMLILCAVLVIVLLYIERKGNPTASLALWIPTFYMLILGSRPLGQWFGKVIELSKSSDFAAGSPLDLIFLVTLLFFALLVIHNRRIEWSRILKDNFALVLLFIYVGISILWSDYVFVSFKRWIRLIEVIPIAMVILGEQSPRDALVSVFRRCAYVLIPFSFLLANYYPNLGRLYSRWSGLLMWTGVTTTKNGLAHLCLLSSIFIIWAFFRDRRMKNISKTVTRTLADGFVLMISVYLLFGGPGGHSATSTANFLLTILSLILLFSMGNRTRQMSTLLICAVVIGWVLLIFSESFVSTFTALLNRSPDFTERADIWAMALSDAASHPILGTGFGGYFDTGNEFSRTHGYSAHNGLLDVYVELGLVGIIFVLVFLLSFFRRVRRELDQSFEWGVFGICLLILSLIANFTESLLISSSSYIWGSMIFLTITLSPSRMDIKENALHIKDLSSPR